MGDADALVAAIDRHGVDVLATLELTDEAVDRLAAAGVEERLPSSVLLPGPRASGGGIHSRWPLTALAPTPRSSVGRTPRALVEIPGGPLVDLHGVHPLPPTNPRWTREWADALGALPVPSVPGPSDPSTTERLLAGDFNATHDHSAFRDLLRAGWVDAAAADGTGLRPTFVPFHDAEPVPPVTLDHVLVGPRVAVEDVSVEHVPGSDHRMLIARVRLPARTATA
jgi:hypothetical protein